MSKFQVNDYQAVQRDLGECLRSLRPACPPRETVRMLLSYDGTGQMLVGLRYDGERAIYYQENNREAIAVQFDGSGLNERCGLVIADLRDDVSLERWVEKMGWYWWGWQHPRYR